MDAHRDVGPPEGSLSFAKEALTRKREEEQKRKATLLRLALWGGGVFGGVLLLGVSVWIALAFRQGGQSDANQRPQGQTPAPSTGVTPAPGTVPTPTPTTDSSSVAPAGTVAPSATPTPDTATTPPAATTTAPSPVVTPGPDVVVQVPSPPGAQPSTTKKPTPKPAPPKPAAKPTPKPAPRDTHPDGEDPASSWTPSDLQPAPATKPVSKPPSATPAPGATTPPNDGQTENPPSSSQPPPDVAPGNPAPSTPSAQPAPTASVPPPAAAPSNPAPAPSGDATTVPPASGGVTKPIDRLHLATETAAQNQDLVTLRKLKESWKALLKSVAGPDRSRAKREMADCLWAIQEISGRQNDRKEALAAYRDYVLTAPAGGVESRSLSRMRYLEESLGEDK